MPHPAVRELFERMLHSFVPENAFDFHAHFYVGGETTSGTQGLAETRLGIKEYRRLMSAWMGDRAPSDGLFFPYPSSEMNVDLANDYALNEVNGAPHSRGLLLVAPGDDESVVTARIDQAGGMLAGFKVYHLFANQLNTMDAPVEAFLPELCWELADNRGLQIMLHLVRARALADPHNQRYIREHCRRYSNARLILAHAGRGFCSVHTLEGLPSIRGLGNVYFDTSAVCEPTAMLAVLQQFGPERLLFGADFPVCNFSGRCSSWGDSFRWLDESLSASIGEDCANPTIVGLESLLAVMQACRLAHLSDADVERIFRTNAEQILRLNEQPTIARPLGTAGRYN